MSPPDENSINTSDSKKEFELPDWPPGEVIDGKFVVTKKKGEGLLGAVYEVKTLKDKRTLALKILRPNLVAEEIDNNRFVRELNIAKQLKHPGIVEYFDIGEFDGFKYFTMELVPGQSLRERMLEYAKEGRDFTPQELYGFLIQIMEILRYAHRFTLHRNLKPENVLMLKEKGKDGKVRTRIRVTDFAIAHVISPTIFASSYVSREEAYYLAPELNRFQDKAGPESDIYSVGAIFYEMLTGKPPQGRYLLPSEVNGSLSKKLDDLVEIALSPNPADRFQTAEDMIATVKLTFADLYGGTGGTVYRVLAVLAVLALICAAAATYFYFDTGPTEEEIAVENAAYAQTVRDEVAAGNETMSDAQIQAKEAEQTGMAYVPPGVYLKGRWKFDSQAGASEYVEIKRFVHGYWIDRYEYHMEDMTPLHSLTWTEAVNLCNEQGKTLCSEDQWEKACKGPENLVYPYGDSFLAPEVIEAVSAELGVPEIEVSAGKSFFEDLGVPEGDPEGKIAAIVAKLEQAYELNVSNKDIKRIQKVRDLIMLDLGACPASGLNRADPYKVGSFERCKSGYGVYDLGGGCWEWTYTKKNNRKITKGGYQPGGEEGGTRCAARKDEKPSFAHQNLSFRCCLNDE